MQYTDQEPKRIYYSIGEVAKMIDVSPSAIRYWLGYFNVDIAKRSSKGTRYFNDKEIDKVKVINYLINIELYTLPGALVKFNEWKKRNHIIDPLLL